MKLLLKILALCVAGFGVYVYFQYRTFQKTVAVGLQLAADAVSYEQHPENPTKRILVVGDSTGVGVGASTSQTSLAGLLGAQFPKADITNKSVSGAKVADVSAQLSSVSGQHFDLVYIQIGGNDIVRHTAFSVVERGLEGMVEQAIHLGDKVVVASCGNIGTARLFPAGTRWLMRIRTLQIREVFRISVPQENVVYVDLYKDEEHDPFAADPARYYAADSFHPSSDGYAVWFDVLHPVMQHVFDPVE